MTELHALAAEINAAGMFVNNLFQKANGDWQANVRASVGLEFAIDPDPLVALRKCFELAKAECKARGKAVVDVSDLV